MSPCSDTDPRVKRTRKLLQDALASLLEIKSFDQISVQDVTEEATLNRATFYAHYPDKFALLQCTTASRFIGFLENRGVSFNSTCGSALRNMLLGLCDYLAAAAGKGSTQHRPMDPYMESSIIAVVRGMVLAGLKEHGVPAMVSPEMLAATVSSALYGAAKEWVGNSERQPAESVVDGVVTLVLPLLHSGESASHASATAGPGNPQ